MSAQPLADGLPESAFVFSDKRHFMTSIKKSNPHDSLMRGDVEFR